MKHKIKWEYTIEGNYGYGWEYVVTCKDREEADSMLKCYNDNEPYPHRIKKVRKIC